MARSQKSAADKAANESILEMIVAVCAAIGSIVFLFWIFAAHKIVWNSLSPLLYLGGIWKLMGAGFGISQWNNLVVEASAFALAPGNVSFLRYLAFVGAALLPYSILSFMSYIGFLVYLSMRKSSDIFRRMTPNMLLQHTVRDFSGIAPVLSIRKKIVDDKLEEWRVQVSPEDVYLGRMTGISMIEGNELSMSKAQEYFCGIKEKTADGRIVSTMLGVQVVHLVNDSKRRAGVVFTDRMSSVGKVLACLWGAVAFGGKEGKKDYEIYRDKLNYSALGSPTGMANLTVAEGLYQKYRKHPMLINIFAVHHWENTALFAILEIAQKKGRYTTAEVLWVRPMNRVLFFSMNTRGSKVPHTEAAMTFAQFAFERRCAAAGRLPLQPDGNGGHIQMISWQQPAVGLKGDFDHWKVSVDDEVEWWTDEEIWKGVDDALVRVSADLNKATAPKEKPTEDSDFDIKYKIDPLAA